MIINDFVFIEEYKNKKDYVYFVLNEFIFGWVKIGRINFI